MMLDLSRTPLTKRHNGWSLIGAATIASSVALAFSKLTGWLVSSCPSLSGPCLWQRPWVLTCCAPARLGW